MPVGCLHLAQHVSEGGEPTGIPIAVDKPFGLDKGYFVGGEPLCRALPDTGFVDGLDFGVIFYFDFIVLRFKYIMAFDAFFGFSAPYFYDPAHVVVFRNEEGEIVQMV